MDEDLELEGKHAVDLPQEFSKYGYKQTAADLHKAMSMASQQEVLDNVSKRGRQAKQQA